MLNKFCFVTIILISFLPNFGEFGYTYASFDDIGLGARPMGMGGSFCAVADDANAIFWNPAGLPHIRKYEFSSTYLNLYGLDVASQFVGVAGRFPPLSIGLGYLRTGEPELYIEEKVCIPLGFMLPDDFAKKIGWHRMSIGLAPKFFRKSFGSDDDSLILQNQSSTTAYSLDAGILLKYGGLGVGAIVENISNQNMALSESDEVKLPRIYRVGVSLKLEELLKFNINMAVEGVRRDGVETFDSIRAGLELQPVYTSFFTMRTGVLSDIELNWKGFAGVGLGVGPVQLDYAFCYQENIGNTHRVSLSVALGRRPAPPVIFSPWEKALNDGVKLYKDNDYQAIRKFTEVFEKLPKEDAKLKNRAFDQIKNKLTYDSSSARFDVVIGYLYLVRKEDTKAENRFERALKKDKSFELPLIMGKSVEKLWYSVKGKVLYGEGLELFLDGKFDESIEIWKTSFCIGFEGARSQSINAYNELIEQAPDEEKSKQWTDKKQAWILLSEAVKESDIDSAIVKLEEAIIFDPNLAEAYLRLGIKYADLFRDDKAKESFKNCLKLEPQCRLPEDASNNAREIWKSVADN